MSMEGPPAPPEKIEKEPVTDAECLEAMKAENFELVRAWYAEQEVIADQDPTGNGRTHLTIKLGKMQFEAGLIDYARETLEAAHMDAYQQGDNATAEQIQAILDEMDQG